MIAPTSEIVGYHGTTTDAVPRLLQRDIRQSDHRFEWLGTGFYLWQDSPWRAQQWAEAKFGDEAAVVAARVSLDACLDLLDPRWQSVLADADAEFVAELLAAGEPIPANRDSGNRARDCATINWFCERAEEQGQSIRSVRAIFEEGDPIFEASAIRTHSHTQVAVRDLTAILELEELTW